jgi:hypothetical protein
MYLIKAFARFKLLTLLIPVVYYTHKHFGKKSGDKKCFVYQYHINPPSSSVQPDLHSLENPWPTDFFMRILVTLFVLW